VSGARRLAGSPIAVSAIAVLGSAVLLYALIAAGYWRGTVGGWTVAVPERFGRVWLEHQAWRMTDAAPAPQEPLPFAVLYGPNVVEQDFRSTAANLARIRVWLDGVPGQRVYVALYKGDGTQSLLYGGTVTLREGQRGGYYDLSFPPIAGSKGGQYTIRVQAPQAALDQPVALRIAPGDAVGGRPSLNGYPVSGNLDFATYHHAWPGSWWFDALGEQLLPHVFRVRIQQYKPGWAKGSVFGGLLVGGALLAFTLLVAAWQGVRGWPQRAGGVMAVLLLGGLAWEAAGGGLLLAGVGARPEPPPPLPAGQRAILDALMSKRPDNLEAARSAAPVEWVPSKEGQGGRYALRTTPAQPFSFSLRLPPGSALRVGVRTGDELAAAEVRLGDERLWQGQAQAAWQQIELDLGGYAGQEAEVRLISQGDAWWSGAHVVSDERWLLSYPLPAGMPLSSQPVRFGDEIEWLGYALEDTELAGDEPVALTLYWRALQPIHRDYTVFVHLVDAEGQPCGGGDGYPVSGTFPTSQWPGNRVVADRRTVPWGKDSPGPCQIEFGLYDLETLQRLPAVGAAGEALPGDRVLLETLISRQGK
jgi:hypothetical protein